MPRGSANTNGGTGSWAASWESIALVGVRTHPVVPSPTFRCRAWEPTTFAAAFVTGVPPLELVALDPPDAFGGGAVDPEEPPDPPPPPDPLPPEGLGEGDGEGKMLRLGSGESVGTGFDADAPAAPATTNHACALTTAEAMAMPIHRRPRFLGRMGEVAIA